MSEYQDTTEKLRSILRAACEELQVVRQLREDPQAFAERFQLSDAERERLERSDLLMVLPGMSLEDGTTISPITITDC
jgi:hypothetical protein